MSIGNDDLLTPGFKPQPLGSVSPIPYACALGDFSQ